MAKKEGPPPPPPPGGHQEHSNEPKPAGPDTTAAGIAPLRSTTKQVARKIVDPAPPDPPVTRRKTESTASTTTIDVAQATARFVEAQQLAEADRNVLSKYTPETLHAAIQSGDFPDWPLLRRAVGRTTLAEFAKHPWVIAMMADDSTLSVALADAPAAVQGDNSNHTFARLWAFSLDDTATDAHLRQMEVSTVANLLQMNGVLMLTEPSAKDRFLDTQAHAEADATILAQCTAGGLHESVQSGQVADVALLRRAYRRYHAYQLESLEPDLKKELVAKIREKYAGQLPEKVTDEEVFATFVKARPHSDADTEVDSALQAMTLEGFITLLLANLLPEEQRNPQRKSWWRRTLGW